MDRYNDKGFSGVVLLYEDTAMSGRAALVVKPVEHISLYGNVATSVTRAPLFSQAPGANGPFQPETAWQGETGVKSEWFNRRIFLTGAFFHINESNILRPDPVMGPQGTNVNALLAVGQARSRGVELNLEGFVTSRWYLTANYAFVSTEITKDNTAALLGKPLANAPRDTMGLFSRWAGERKCKAGTLCRNSGRRLSNCGCGVVPGVQQLVAASVSGDQFGELDVLREFPVCRARR